MQGLEFVFLAAGSVLGVFPRYNLLENNQYGTLAINIANVGLSVAEH